MHLNRLTGNQFNSWQLIDYSLHYSFAPTHNAFLCTSFIFCMFFLRDLLEKTGCPDIPDREERLWVEAALNTQLFIWTLQSPFEWQLCFFLLFISGIPRQDRPPWSSRCGRTSGESQSPTIFLFRVSYNIISWLTGCCFGCVTRIDSVPPCRKIRNLHFVLSIHQSYQNTRAFVSPVQRIRLIFEPVRAAT